MLLYLHYLKKQFRLSHSIVAEIFKDKQNAWTLSFSACQWSCLLPGPQFWIMRSDILNHSLNFSLRPRTLASRYICGSAGFIKVWPCAGPSSSWTTSTHCPCTCTTPRQAHLGRPVWLSRNFWEHSRIHQPQPLLHPLRHVGLPHHLQRGLVYRVHGHKLGTFRLWNAEIQTRESACRVNLEWHCSLYRRRSKIYNMQTCAVNPISHREDTMKL